MTFRPSIGMDGFRVVTSFNIDEIKCEDLQNDINQLGIILYSPDVINEKLLIRLRDCVVNLAEGHPLKRWLKWVGTSKPLKEKDQKRIQFITEIINSPFNLITDNKVKSEIIESIMVLPEKTIAEQILKSYLYLVIGNITRSDNMLKDIIRAVPRLNWEKSGINEGIYHHLAKAQMGQIFKKLGKHPADRSSFKLLSLYLQNFYNDETLVNIAADVDTQEVESKMELKYIEGISVPLVHFLRLKSMPDNQNLVAMRDLKTYPLNEQAYWLWPFFDIDPLISATMNEELTKLEKEDELWFIYLMDNEKLSDTYSLSKGKTFLPKRRQFLKEGLNNNATFMMSLYKLIELGDIDSTLIIKATDRITNE